MPNAVLTRRIRIFLSSPADVADERNRYAEAVEELNVALSALLPERNVVVDLIRWETDTHPDLTGSPQDVVDDQIDVDYDVFVGIMWARFGTPTATAGSGTEHEFRAAYAAWHERRRPAHLLFYFSAAPISAEFAGANADQLKKVYEFRQELEKHGLVGSYASPDDFGRRSRRDLVRVVGGLLRPDEPAARVAGRLADRASDSDRAVVRAQLGALTREYGAIRAALPAGWERTRRLEIVASKMRTLGPSIFALLPELTVSPDAGERLAAVSALQLVPDVDYVDWLADRFGTERAFVQYHAAGALLTAARDLRLEELDRVERALTLAEFGARSLAPEQDRVQTLHFARDELRRRTGR